MNRLFLLLLLAGLPLTANAAEAHRPAKGRDQNAVVQSFLDELTADNSVYMATHNIEFFSALSKGQKPKATVVTCSDSRVQANMFERAPEGELFTVRNIGNQLVTAEGSVEYGVHHLHTPILLFIGHSRCGAIAAVGGNYSKESPAIKRELDTIGIPKELNNLDGVKANVNNQVGLALLKFSDEVEAKRLTVIGAVLDFADDMHQGAGKLHLINLNGITDPVKLQNLNALLPKAKPAAAPAEKPAEKKDAPEAHEAAHH